MANREKYGIDAPGVARTLGVLGLGILGYAFLPSHVPGERIAFMMWPTGVCLLAGSAWMLASSLWFKKRVMRSLIGQRSWRGDETVLDVGCGRGLLAIEAARRVPHGMVHGIDLWQAADLSGNGPGGIRENATAAGVDRRLVVETGDARKLPYPDAAFDVVSSMTAIHNIQEMEGRRMAISEMWRVLRPGGQVLIFDIRHAKSYLRQLRDLGAIDPTLNGPILLWGMMGWRLSATKPSHREQ